MADRYRVRLAPRNEGVEYADDHDVYRFNAQLVDGVWNVRLPPAKGRLSEFTDAERRVVLPRIRNFLSRTWWFGVFPRSYGVNFVEDEPIRDDSPFSTAYHIGFTRAKDGVDYRDDYNSYRFALQREGRVWTVRLPPLRGHPLTESQLSDEERQRILPRIREYLRRGRSFGVFPKSYEVNFLDVK